MNNNKTPIISRQARHYLLEELKNARDVYYLITKIIIETGCTFDYLKYLKVNDIKGTRHISYTLKYANNPWEEDIPESTYEELLSYSKNKDGDSYLFTGRTNKNPISNTAYLKALASCARRCGYLNGITVYALRMCYCYDLIQKEGTLDTAKRYLKAHSYKEIYEKLNLPEDAIPIKKKSSAALLLSKKPYEECEKRLSDTFGQIHLNIQKLDKLDDAAAQRILRFIDALNRAVDDYEGKF